MISAILETWFQALRLATLSALPVPMLRQVYRMGFFAWDVLTKWALGDFHFMSL